MSVITKRAAGLSLEEKRALLAQLLEEKAHKPKTLPASSAQRPLWFLDQLEPGLSAYHVHMAVEMTGQLDLTALERSLNEVVRRHETLRTTFEMLDGRLVQVIAAANKTSWPLPVIDLRAMPSAEQSAKVQQQAVAEARQPFDLARGPLMRATLLRLREDEHVLLLTMHHIISDGWSTGILIRELGHLYQAFADGQSPLLPALPIQYADFTAWQDQHLQGETLESLLSYWKEQLGGDLPVLELPCDRVRPVKQSFRGAWHIVQLPDALWQGVQELSRREGVTPFMTLLAAFEALLYRYTGQEDVVVGTPIANRNRAEIEGLIGLFVNMLVLRTSLSGNPIFLDLLERVRSVTSAAYAHSDMPFEKLLEELRLRRDLSRPPLFQVMFALQNAPAEIIELPGLKLKILPVERGTTHYDLSLHLIEKPEHLLGMFEYNTDLFKRESIERMMGHYRTLLEGIVADPTRRLSDLAILTETERQQMLVKWNDTRMEYPQDCCIHELFEAQVERTPEAVALIFPSDSEGGQDQHLSYRELNRRANQLAHFLRGQGVGPEVPAGICVERSPDMVVGILGILKAGGAYVPMDPAYPLQRLAFIRQDAQIAVLLTQVRLVETLAEQRAQLICLDRDWDTIIGESRERSDENPVNEVTSGNLAYVIYTSGSTGRPKGVAIEHRSAVAMLEWSKEHFLSEDRAGVLASTSICFDLSVFELFMPLSQGGRVILVEDALQLPALPAAQAVTLINTVPSAMKELVRMDGIPASTRTVNLAGEPLQKQLVQQVYQRDHVRRVFNLYGPSEDTTYSTFSLIGKEIDRIPPIGRPIANSQVHLLDSQGGLVPVGVPGELHISGDGLARGYLNRPELTADRFIPNPFSDQPGARLYRTGDLARYLIDGRLEFLGRIDHQVKIRGFRIELGEVEAALRQHPAVEETVVVAWGDVPGEQRLVAYVVDHHQSTLEGERASLPTVSELWSFLKVRLPDYMLPSAFVPLEALPLTPNGKVDRQALPAPETTRPELDSAFAAPRTLVEEMLVTLWIELLDIEQVGIYDNFFELGGHSLLGIQLLSRIRETFEVELPLRSLFEATTTAKLAERIELATKSERLRIPPIEHILRGGDLPLSFAQQRLWFLDQLEPGKSTYNIPAAIRLTGSLNIVALEQSLNETVRRHETLRTTFTISKGLPVQVIVDPNEEGADWLLQVVDLQEMPQVEQTAEVQRRTVEEAQQPFNLARGPLVRATLLRLGKEEHVLLLTMHHIVSDGWSVGVLVRELGQLYQAFADGQIALLPALPIQYADFAIWQRQWLQGEVLEAQLSYWKKQLGGTLPVLDLPSDRVRPPLQSFRGARHIVQFPAMLNQKLQRLGQRERVTLFMTMLAAFKVLLYRYTGQEDVIVGSPIANRNQVEIEGLIGFFVNMLVLRTDLSGNPTFRELLSRVREVALGAYTHSDFPFEKLVEELQSQRDLSRSPLFQVAFVLQNTPEEVIELPELKLSTLSAESGTAHFDLSLFLSKSSEGLRGVFEYNTDLFEKETIERLSKHYRTLLEGIVADPEQCLADLPLMTEVEQIQLALWNETETDYPQDQCLHQLIEAQVERTPAAIAVVCEGEQLTYQELNRRANQLARHLQKLGVGPDVLVGFCIERSLEMVIALVGILKAGGAYVQLDPTHPAERLAFLLDDIDTPVILLQTEFMEQISQIETCRSEIVCLERDGNIIARESTHNLVHRTTSGDLAYVSYTSGSTGVPKGVRVVHRGVARLVKENNYAHLSAEDIFLQLAPVAFDASTLELWGSLLNGGRLVMFPARQLSLDELGAVVEQEQVSVLWLTAGVFHLMVEQQLPSLRGVRQLLAGGDTLSVPHVQKVLEGLAENSWLINGYGPTENTTFTTCYAMNKIGQVGTTVSIGRPIANTQVYVLDRWMQPVPVGITGELYVGGAGLARDYLNRPELTAERFVPNPFSSQAGARLYKTGDLVRYLANGNVEFLGRADFQVKIRGFRIEPGEIEAVLGEHPAVREAVVLDREYAPGDKRLVAYITPDQRKAFTVQQPLYASSDAIAHESTSDWTNPEQLVSDVRRFLETKLPKYMEPAAFVILENLPLLPNGKVNRAALPAPNGLRPKLGTAFVAPRTKLEQTIAAIWQETLRAEKVGRDDNFFELGGHSLLLVQVHTKLQKALERDLSILEMFKYPTISSLAGYISQGKKQSLARHRNENRTEKLKEGRQRLTRQLERKRQRGRYRGA